MNRTYYFSQLLLFASSLLITNNVVYAAVTPYLGIDIGTNIVSTSTQRAAVNLGDVTDYYVNNNKNANSLVAGLQTGVEFTKRHRRYMVDLGVGLYDVPTPFKYTGQLIECSQCSPNDLISNYRYKIATQRAMFEARINLREHKFAPYIDAGIGVARNRLTAFQETAADSTSYLPYPPFSTHTNTNFAYQVGIGVGYSVRIFSEYPRKERLMIGYRYVGLGEVTSGIRSAAYPYALDVGKLNDNEIYFGYVCIL